MCFTKSICFFLLLVAELTVLAGDAAYKDGTEDVTMWLSAAVTNQETCKGDLASASGSLRTQMSDRIRDVSGLLSNAVSLYAARVYPREGIDGVPIHNRRLMSSPGSRFPSWMSRSDLEVLQSTLIQPDVVVSKGGENATLGSISQAINMAPEMSSEPFIIHVKAGRYEEDNLTIGGSKTNVWIIGEGRGQTVIAGSKSVARNNISTSNTATFAAFGDGFVAKDITFRNEAGPGSQAVALIVKSDQAVIYRCAIEGYQDSLYTHSKRQFYRECDISGTVDFIFGDATVVFQECTIWARNPKSHGQSIVLTAQKRSKPTEKTGMSFHSCRIMATPDLEPVKLTNPTFLGRPWDVYARVVFMGCFIGDHVDPTGWLKWNSSSPVDKVYYGEFNNTGPGANTTGRVKWPRVDTNMSEPNAKSFTTAEFIQGPSWIPPTGVPFEVGL